MLKLWRKIRNNKKKNLLTIVHINAHYVFGYIIYLDIWVKFALYVYDK